ncbi:ABC transporter permease [Terasakiella pusilla]|uniref:ABC transporter permease n=1 Tax=Terasakiella pusilla TaxID=64973 RepID=UPI00048E2AB6|nr:ABC transporter permease [Terasakiella pusilla]
MQTVFKIAWGNTFQNMKRTLTALGGISFSILLIFLQLGFLNGAKKEVTLLFDYFDFDLALSSDRYQFMATAPPFDRIRIIQARVDEAIGDSFLLNVRSGRWVDEETELESSLLIIGMDSKEEFIKNPDFITGLESITNGQSIFLDRFSHADFGPLEVGRQGYVNGTQVNVTSLFDLGLFFFAEGSVATSNGNFVNLSGRTADDVTLGFLKVKEGFDHNETVDRMRTLLPDDVLIVTREEFYEREQDYFIEVKPIGIMFRSAVFIAFAVGLVILFQVLSTELSNRLDEFATMKAMGFSVPFIYGIGIMQNLIITFMSFFPAWIICVLLFKLIYGLSKLPMEMTFSLFATVLGLTLLMSITAGVLALRKVKNADPAELF